MSPASTPRSYRSSKRNRPCDRCRETKTRCLTGTGSPCPKCQRDGLQCTFSSHARSRTRPTTRLEHANGRTSPPATQFTEQAIPSGPHSPGSLVGDLQDRSLQQSQSIDLVPLHQPPLQPAADVQFDIQFAQSLETMEGHSAQLFGSSAESDPWLLRHCRFDGYGTFSFQNTKIRNAGGVPSAHKILIHFTIESHGLHESAKKETRATNGQLASREELNHAVPPQCGQRLVALFCEHVFPILPVISRSQLGVSRANRLPPWSALEHCPLHLLAALYAMALRFVAEDEHLAVWYDPTSMLIESMWRLVHDELQEAAHQPHLSVVQATLLYLHKEPADERRYYLSETPFVWSWTGKLVGLSASLGLHTECSMWAIPSWEKKLRKRIWWAIYAEDKWRSLLMGRPSYIHKQGWDVEELDSSHWSFPPVNGDNVFRSFVELTSICESVQDTFYSLRASQKLSVDMGASVQAARPLLQRLELWRSSQAQYDASDNSMGKILGPGASIHFAYHLLVIYIYRALYRPMVQSTVAPHVVDIEEPVALEDLLVTDDFSWDLPALTKATPFPTLHDIDAPHIEYLEDVVRAASECAAGMINLVRRFSFAAVSSFWLSWFRFGFAVASNFIVLLVVQAPNAQHAALAKQLLDNWGQTLKEQCRLLPMVRLGMLRLNSLNSAGLPQIFHLPSHVEQILDLHSPGGTERQDPPMSRYRLGSRSAA